MLTLLTFGILILLFLKFCLLPIIRNSKSKQTMSSDESSESEEELKTESLNWKQRTKDFGLDTDASYVERKRGKRILVGLTISDVEHIRQNLDDYEEKSLIFLLSEKPKHCLERFKLSEWAEKEMSDCPHWEEKIWEALTIIKHFQIPKKYGLLKEDLIEEYFPFNPHISKYISKFKKTLYFICENLKESEEKLFLRELKKDFKLKNLPTFPQMEMYFSFLLQIGYLSKDNTKNCARIMKRLDLEKAQDLLENIESSNSCLTKSTNITVDKINNDTFSFSSLQTFNYDSISMKSMDSLAKDAYKMDGIKLCLIINQKNFHSEVNPDYKHLLPPNNEDDKLKERHGTDNDAQRLEKVFKRRGFRVIMEKNLDHIKTVDAIERIVENIDMDCFFVTILSHGNKGVVYCANSCHVKISRIVEIMSVKKLIKIPKVLVLQTCQGPSLQIADDDLTTDGDSSNNDCDDPKVKNFLVFSSTVPRFASVRDKKKGSWFIQTLCEEIESVGDRVHFLDICTRVTNKVSNLKWNKDGKLCYMVPYKKDTFTKQLFL